MIERYEFYADNQAQKSEIVEVQTKTAYTAAQKLISGLPVFLSKNS